MTTLHCAACDQDQLHKIRRRITRPVSRREAEQYQVPFARVTAQILECCGCLTFSFQEIFHDSDTPVDNDEAPEEISTYPDRRERLPREYRAIPKNIADIYREVVYAFNHRLRVRWLLALPVLCTIGLGVLLEAICKDKGATGEPDKNGRFGTVDALERLLPANVVLALHEVRRSGNNAKHEMRPLGAGDLARALDAIEAVLDSLYELEAKAVEFQLRAPIRRKAPQSESPG